VISQRFAENTKTELLGP